MLLISGSFTVGDTTTTTKRKVSMKLMASLAPALSEIEAGGVAKADQFCCCCFNFTPLNKPSPGTMVPRTEIAGSIFCNRALHNYNLLQN